MGNNCWRKQKLMADSEQLQVGINERVSEYHQLANANKLMLSRIQTLMSQDAQRNLADIHVLASQHRSNAAQMQHLLSKNGAALQLKEMARRVATTGKAEDEAVQRRLLKRIGDASDAVDDAADMAEEHQADVQMLYDEQRDARPVAQNIGEYLQSICAPVQTTLAPSRPSVSLHQALAVVNAPDERAPETTDAAEEEESEAEEEEEEELATLAA